MNDSDDDQALVSALLASIPAPLVAADFVSRVNARIDETAGWSALADFRVWTLGLAPAAAALALLAILWPGPPTSSTPSASSGTGPAGFSPASATDWQQEVSADALLDAAFHPAPGGVRVR